MKALTKTFFASIAYLACSSVAYCNESSVEKRLPDISAELAAPLCYTFPGSPQIKISRDGNITQFANAAGGNHFFLEGYSLCSTGATRHSNNISDSGFSISSCSCAGPVCTVTRNTSDGKLQLIQKFTKAASPIRTLDVQMTVKNLTAAPVGNVVLRRHVVADISGAISEYYAETRDAVFSWGTKADGIPFGIALRHLNRSPTSSSYSTYTSPFYDGDACTPAVDSAASGPVFGDFVSSIVYGLGSIGGGAQKAVTVQYARD